jgi:transcriptional regulator with XRE-family HTH domain
VHSKGASNLASSGLDVSSNLLKTSTMAKFSVLNAVLQRRHEMGFSQEYIAEELDMKQSNYSKIESGYNKVRWEELDTLFDILELTVVPRDTRERKETAYIIHKLFSKHESINRIRSVIHLLDEIVKEYKDDLDEMGPHNFISEDGEEEEKK